MQVKDIMTSEPMFIASDASIRAAASRMSERQIGFLAVRTGTQLVGVVTDRDLALRPAEQSKGYDAATVGDVMSTHTHTVRADAPVAHVAAAMKAKSVRRMLVINERKELVGVVSLADLAVRSADVQLGYAVLRHLASSRTAPARASDAAAEAS